VVAAVYLDSGFESARRVVMANFEDLIQGSDGFDLLGDYKTPLQEMVQSRYKSTPVYVVVSEHGPDHEKVFEVEVLINGSCAARGRGRSKKESEQDAARKALREWDRD
jgi:ribonuclease-3